MFPATIRIPQNDKDFEHNCVVLFAVLINDENVKTVASRGKRQQGLDLIGRRGDDPLKLVGVQCKLRTQGHALTRKEAEKDILAALRFDPPLSEYYIVTTASDDLELERLAAQVSRTQAKQYQRKIRIEIWGWQTLEQKIRAHQVALDAFDPGHSATTDEQMRIARESAQGIARSERHLQRMSEDPLFKTRLARAPKEWSARRRKLDVFDLSSPGSLLGMRWRLRWEPFPLRPAHMLRRRGHILIRNTGGGHNHAKIILNKRLVGDFQAVLVLRGRYKDVQFQMANGEDKNINCNLAAQGIDVLEVQRVVLTRIGARVDFSVSAIEARPRRLRYDVWQADVTMDCYVAIAVADRDEFELHSFSVSVPVRR